MELVITITVVLITPTLVIILYKYSKDLYNCLNRRTSKFKFKIFEDNI